MAKPYVPYEGPVVTRAEARALGLKRYFTGRPCSQGHFAERQWQGNCTACHQARGAVDRSKDEYRTRRAKWREANREETRKKKRVWYANNKARVQTQNYASNRRNIDRYRAYVRNRRAKRRSAPGSHTADDISRIFAAQKGRCAYCRKVTRSNYHVDHIEPLSKGGTNLPRNLQITCPSCNTSKCAMDPIAFAQKSGFLL